MAFENQGAVNGITVSDRGAISCVGPVAVNFYRLAALRGALKLETVGIRASRGFRASVVVRETIGSKTKNKTALLAELDAYIEQYRAANQPSV